MRFYSCIQLDGQKGKTPFSLHGLLGRREEGAFWRLPDEVIDTVSGNVSKIARRASGGRVRFRTDSPKIVFRMGLKTLEVAQHMPLSGSAGADVFLGQGAASRYAALIAPEDYTHKTAEITLVTDGRWNRSPSISPGMNRWIFYRSGWKKRLSFCLPSPTAMKHLSSFTGHPLQRAVRPPDQAVPIPVWCAGGWTAITSTLALPAAPRENRPWPGSFPPRR